MLSSPLVVRSETPLEGLDSSDVALRAARGLCNVHEHATGRSVGDIIRSNVVTRINAILVVLFVCVMVTGSIVNGAFGLLIVAN